MKKLLILAAALMLSGALSAQVNTNTAPYVEVTANAYREVTPDEIFVQITLDENDSKGKVPMNKLEADMFKALKKANVNIEKNLTINDIESEYKTYLLRKNDGRTTKSFLVQVNNEQLAPLFRALNEYGIDNVNIQSARYSKISMLRDELRVEAAKAAKTRATLLAEAVGQKIGKAILIQNFESGNPIMYNNIMMARSNMKMAADGAMESAPTVDFKKMRIESNVTIRFELPQ